MAASYTCMCFAAALAGPAGPVGKKAWGREDFCRAGSGSGWSGVEWSLEGLSSSRVRLRLGLQVWWDGMGWTWTRP